MPTDDLRALDARLAEAMGWREVHAEEVHKDFRDPAMTRNGIEWFGLPPDSNRQSIIDRYSTSLADAFELVEWMRGEGWTLQLHNDGIDDLNEGLWQGCFYRRHKKHYAESDAVPEAISRAAAKALGVE